MTLNEKNTEEICGDLSVSGKIFRYLEKALPDDEMKEVADHASGCDSCLKTMVLWHYECIRAERDEQIIASSKITSNVWDWRLGSQAQPNKIPPSPNKMKTEIEVFH